MFQQPNHLFESTDSGRRLSSNNPFRQFAGIDSNKSGNGQSGYEAPRLRNQLGSSVKSNGSSAFEDWVEKNKQLVNISSDEEDDLYGAPKLSTNIHPSSKHINLHSELKNGYTTNRRLDSNDHNDDLARPVFPGAPVRAGSDSNVNYNNGPTRYVNFFIFPCERSGPGLGTAQCIVQHGSANRRLAATFAPNPPAVRLNFGMPLLLPSKRIEALPASIPVIVAHAAGPDNVQCRPYWWRAQKNRFGASETRYRARLLLGEYPAHSGLLRLETGYMSGV